MKKEFEITMTFTVMAERSVTAEDVSEYADQLAEDIKENDDFRYRDNIEISDVSVHDIEDNSFDDHVLSGEDEDE